MVAESSAAKAPGRGKSSSRRTGYYKALMNPKSGPLVGIPTFVPVQTQRQRVRAVGSLTSVSGALSINVNPRRFVANDSVPVRWRDADGGSDAEWHAATFINNNAEHSASDFGDGSDLKARVVALQITLKNVSSLNDRNGMFYALQERHHHNLANKTSVDLASDAKCIIQSATDGDIKLLYRPVQPREVEDWQHNHVRYPDETTENAIDGGPLDTFPGFMEIIWKGSASAGTPQNFFLEVDAIIEYAGETKDMVSSDPHTGAGGAIQAMPRDIPHVVADVAHAEQNPQHHRSIVAQMESAAFGGLKWLGHQLDPTSSRGRRNLGYGARVAGYLGSAYTRGGAAGVRTAARYGAGRLLGTARRSFKRQRYLTY